MFRKLSKVKMGNGYFSSDLVRVKDYSLKGRRRTVIFLLVLIALVLTGWAGIFFFFNRPEISSNGGQEDVMLKIKTPDNVVSGESVTFFVSIRNDGSADLTDADLTVDFPAGFSFQSSRPAAESQFSGGADWLIENIPKNSEKAVEITGQLLGGVGEKKSLKSTLNYKLADLSAGFQKNASVELEINSSMLAVEIKSPSRTLEDKSIVYEIAVKNTGKSALHEVKLITEYPADFVLEASEPTQMKSSLFMDQQNNYWPLDVLDENEEKKLKLTGHFSGGAGQFQKLGIEAGINDDFGNFHSLVKKNNLVFVVESGLSLDLKINGREDGEQSADWGDILDGELAYENKGDMEIEDASLRVGLTDALDKILDRDKMREESQSGNFQTEDLLPNAEEGGATETMIFWNQANEPNLALLKPGDQGRLKFRIFLQSPLVEKDPAFIKSYFTVKSRADGLLPNFESDALPKENIQVDGNQIQVKINTQVLLDAEVSQNYAEKFSGQEIREIIWRLTNGTNEIKNVKISTVLPVGVDWISSITSTLGQNLQFDDQTREVSWQISQVSPFGGGIDSPAKATFKVRVATDLRLETDGRAALTGDILFQAKDGFTGKDFLIRQGSVRISR